MIFLGTLGFDIKNWAPVPCIPQPRHLNIKHGENRAPKGRALCRDRQTPCCPRRWGASSSTWRAPELVNTIQQRFERQALGDFLKAVFELDATTSVLAATHQHSTAQHKEASRLEDLANIFRVEGVSSPFVLTCCIVCLVLVLQPLLGGRTAELAMANPVRSIENVTITMAREAVREGDSKIVRPYFLPRTRITAFQAKECSTMRFLCAESLVASSVLGSVAVGHTMDEAQGVPESPSTWLWLELLGQAGRDALRCLVRRYCYSWTFKEHCIASRTGRGGKTIRCRQPGNDGD
jgi:hypothetical protein